MDLEGAVKAVGDMLRRTRARVDGMITRAVIGAVNDGLKTQRITITALADDPATEVEHFQPYGLSFTPPKGAESLRLAIGGKQEHTVAILAQHPDQRPKGNGDPGTGGLYTNGAWLVFLDKDKLLHLGAKTADHFVALADLVKAELDDIRAKFDAHQHMVTTSGSPSSHTGTAAPVTSPMGPAGEVASETVKSA